MPEETSQKTITSDHGGFAALQPPAMQRPPANSRLPEES